MSHFNAAAKTRISLYSMILFYLAGGIYHFLHPLVYQQLMPTYIPNQLHLALIYISGACEIGFALLLLPTATRPLAAWCIMALLVAVFPANVQMAMNYYHADEPMHWLSLARLPLQIPLIWWAYTFTKPSARLRMQPV